MIRIASTQYSINTQSFELYFSGCKANPHCEDCHNPELWSFNVGKEYTPELRNRLLRKINGFNTLIDNISLLGGDPMDQDLDELISLIDDFESCKKKVWLFTRFELDEIPDKIKSKVDFIKTGRYLPRDKSNHVEYGVVLASANQHVYKRGKDF
jgi:organic radical activating enzyme